MNLKRVSLIGLVLVLIGLFSVSCGPEYVKVSAGGRSNESRVAEDPEATAPPTPTEEPFEEEPASHEILLVKDVLLNFIRNQNDVSFQGLDWEEIQFGKDDYSFSAASWEVVIDTGINLLQERVYWATVINEETEFEWEGRVYPGGDVEAGPHGILSALDSAILAINLYFPDDAPPTLLVWVGEDIASKEYEVTMAWLYTSGEWEMQISYVFVGEGTPIYAVYLINNQAGFMWLSEHDAGWNLLTYQATQ